MNVKKDFTEAVLHWYDQHGRKDLPWQHPRSAYFVWISEIMLQQTQVQTVIPYFNRFISSFPTIQVLAEADEDFVLSHWSGLGYYSRARNIHKTAKLICDQFAGEIPANQEQLINLPGIGPSTAAAILSQAFNLPAAIMDGNVKRVLSRYFMVEGWPEQSQIKKQLWQLADDCMPKQRCAEYTQAIMDLGAMCCTSRQPDCLNCPVQQNCLALKHQRVLELPTKKAKKTLPVKRQQFLLLYNKQHQIYLEKRPPSGLWGGLWCLPDAEEQSHIETEIETRFALKVITAQKLMNLKHTFSHFHLFINATAIQTESILHPPLNENTGQWFSSDQLDKLGMARPVSKIINCFLDKHRSLSIYP